MIATHFEITLTLTSYIISICVKSWHHMSFIHLCRMNIPAVHDRAQSRKREVCFCTIHLNLMCSMIRNSCKWICDACNQMGYPCYLFSHLFPKICEVCTQNPEQNPTISNSLLLQRPKKCLGKVISSQIVFAAQFIAEIK